MSDIFSIEKFWDIIQTILWWAAIYYAYKLWQKQISLNSRYIILVETEKEITELKGLLKTAKTDEQKATLKELIKESETLYHDTLINNPLQ